MEASSTDPATLERIHALAIPPAWASVWIAPEADAHLQATGIDRRGRKQYRYHASWRQERDALKYRDMEDFARIQPALRSRISSDLKADRELSHLRVLALALRLLDIGLFRIGSDRYARDNAHYGLTTLHLDQVTIRGGAATFDYVGKAGRRQHLTITDSEALAVLSALKRRRSGPEELLAFRGPHGWTRIHREDVNNFLRAEAAGPFSAKEYRTWNATVIAAVQLAELRPAPSRAPTVASRAVARSAREHPRCRQTLLHRSADLQPVRRRPSRSSSITYPTDHGNAVQSSKPASWQPSRKPRPTSNYRSSLNPATTRSLRTLASARHRLHKTSHDKEVMTFPPSAC